MKKRYVKPKIEEISLANTNVFLDGESSGDLPLFGFLSEQDGMGGPLKALLNGFADLFDENGNPLYDEFGNPLYDENGNPLYDENGNPLYDENGNPLFDENGNPIDPSQYEGSQNTPPTGEVDPGQSELPPETEIPTDQQPVDPTTPVDPNTSGEPVTPIESIPEPEPTVGQPPIIEEVINPPVEETYTEGFNEGNNIEE